MIAQAQTPSIGLAEKKEDGRLIFRKLKGMLGWRFAAMAISASGGIWASRCLGPEALGISATVQAISTQVLLFTHLGQNNFLIRQYKNVPDRTEQKQLVENVVILRAVLSLSISALAVIFLWVRGIPGGWGIAVGAGIAAFILEAQTPDWLLQAQENQTAIYRSTLWGAIFSSACYFIFFRRGAGAGTNLVVAVGAAIVVRILTYRAALSGTGKLHLSLTKLNDGLRLAWAGRYFFLTVLVTYIYTQGEQLLLAALRPTEELGIYKSALQLSAAGVPFFTIVTALIYPRIIEWRKMGGQYLWKKQVGLGAVALGGWALLSGLSFLIIPFAYPHLFGPQFQSGAIPCALLLTNKMLVVVVSIFVYSLWAYGKDRTMLVICAVTSVVSLGLNLWLIPKYGMLAASAIGVLSELLMLAAGVVLSYQLAMKSLADERA